MRRKRRRRRSRNEVLVRGVSGRPISPAVTERLDTQQAARFLSNPGILLESGRSDRDLRGGRFL